MPDYFTLYDLSVGKDDNDHDDGLHDDSEGKTDAGSSAKQEEIFDSAGDVFDISTIVHHFTLDLVVAILGIYVRSTDRSYLGWSCMPM